MKHLKIIFCALAILPWLATPSAAKERDRHHERADKHGPRWHGEIRHFHERDWDTWRRGRWVHDRHNGRLGWWWLVAGIWYFYPYPVYPYPDPYQPPVITPPAMPQYWYYCADPPGYYPYVAECRIDWQQVPASPPPYPSR